MILSRDERKVVREINKQLKPLLAWFEGGSVDEWWYTVHPGLGCAPIEALRAGRSQRIREVVAAYST